MRSPYVCKCRRLGSKLGVSASPGPYLRVCVEVYARLYVDLYDYASVETYRRNARKARLGATRLGRVVEQQRFDLLPYEYSPLAELAAREGSLPRPLMNRGGRDAN